MMRSRIFCLPVIILSFLFLLQTTIVSAADHPIFQPVTGYSTATDEKGPGIAAFARSSGNDIDVQGEKTVIRYQLNSGTKEPGVSEIVSRYSKIASDRKGWTYLYTDRTLYMGFTEQGGREYFVEVYVGDEYYDLIVVERGASGTATTGVTAQQASNASQIQKAGTSGLTTQQGTPSQAQQPDVVAADTSQKDDAVSGLSASSTKPQGLEVGQSGGAQGAGGQSSTGGGSSIPASIQITSPGPNAILFAGEQTDARWIATGVESVEIGYVIAGSFQSLARNVPAAGGVYRITLPATLNSRNNSYTLKVRSNRSPHTPESAVSVTIYPHVDLELYPFTNFNQRDWDSSRPIIEDDVWANVARLTIISRNNGIDPLNEISARLQIKNPDNGQLFAQGDISVTGTLIPGMPFTMDPLLCICTNGISVIQDQDDNGRSCGCAGGRNLESGHYKMYIMLLNSQEPVELQENNTNDLEFDWHTVGSYH